jgi:hypothetical protein
MDKNSEIQIGLPCVYETLCYWLGIGFVVLVFALVAAIMLSVWRDNKKRRKKLKNKIPS